jgi:hypothetical protein
MRKALKFMECLIPGSKHVANKGANQCDPALAGNNLVQQEGSNPMPPIVPKTCVSCGMVQLLCMGASFSALFMPGVQQCCVGASTDAVPRSLAMTTPVRTGVRGSAAQRVQLDMH